MSNHNNNNVSHNHSHHRINNGTQACAACKYQRRKCAPDCILAPYFPHDRQRQFLNAHKLFGVSNITKIIRGLNPPDKDMAMRTIIFQSDARAKDPVGGCYRIIRDLHHQIEYCKAELELVLQQLALCKAQAYQATQLMQMCPSGTPQPVEVPTEQGNPTDGDLIQATSVDQGGQIAEDELQEYQELIRCYYGDIPTQQQGQNDDIPAIEYASWGQTQEETVLASSNSSTNNNQGGECNVMRPDECDGFDVKNQMNINVGCGSYEDETTNYGSKFDDLKIDVITTCSDVKRDELKFEPAHATELSGEVILKEDTKILLEDQEDPSFYHHHHIPEHDLRNTATLFTLT